VVTNEVYIYAGPNRIAEYSASQPATNPLRQRVFADGIDSLSAIVQSNGNVLIPTRNRQWSIVALTDNSTGSVLERYSYDQFGERTIYAANGTTTRTTSTYTNNYGYTSREQLPESGLMYFRARHYDQTFGEFLSKDLMEFVDGTSLYRAYFVPGGVDPFGLIGIFFEGTGRSPGDATIMQALANSYGDGTSLIYYTNFWPNNIWPNIKDAHKRVCSEICDAVPEAERCTSPTQHEPVDLFGWSRGALAAITLGKRLKDQGCECEFRCPKVVRKCEYDDEGNIVSITRTTTFHDKTFTIKPIDIRFMGLIDPVGTGGGQMVGTTTQISDNVTTAWAGMSSVRANIGHLIFRSTTPTVEDAGKTSLTVKSYAIRHQWIGWKNQTAVFDDLKGAAEAAGVNFE